jgi:predicted nucleic-acid-binding Zn-ribbon protein
VKDEERVQGERRRALAWMTEKWVGERTCPICQTNNWTIGDIVELRPYEGGNLIVGSTRGLFPAFQVICDYCGYTHLVNAAKSGVVRIEEYKSENTSDE